MKLEKRSDKHLKQLREKAARELSKLPILPDNISRKEIETLFEELQIHQIELEIQNEELIRVQQTLEVNRKKYVDLFEHAPIAYAVLDAVGIIKHFNSAFLNLLDGLNLTPSGQAFADLLEESDTHAFRARYKAFFKSPRGKQIEARLATKAGQFLDVLIEACQQPNRQAADQPSAGEELLVMVTDVTDLQHAKRESETALTAMRKKEAEISCLLEAARLIIEQKQFNETVCGIFDICSRVIESSAGYILMLPDRGRKKRILFPDACGVSRNEQKVLEKQIADLQKNVCQSAQAAYDNYPLDGKKEGRRSLPEFFTQNVLLSPIVAGKKPVGVMVFANKGSDFSDMDGRAAQGFGELTAIAYKNERLRKKRNRAEKEKTDLINELTQAMKNIKTLSGLIPICQHCKKIRDDKGYWNQIEVYIAENSDAKLSHGICKECAKKYYPDMDIYKE